MIQRFGFRVNTEKLKHFRPGEVKVITGLEVKEEGISVPETFFHEVKAEIRILKDWVLMQTRMHPSRSLEKQLGKPLQKINGALNFIATVHGSDDSRLHQLEQKLEEAIQPPADYESLNWLQIGYETV